VDRDPIEGTDQPEPRPVDPERYRQQSIGSSGFDGFLYGTPERVAADISQHYAGTPVETVIFWASLAGMPEPMVLAHIADVAAVADLLSKQDVITRR
jgi:hypothetical protein